jgi:hypothetical protein
MELRILIAGFAGSMMDDMRQAQWLPKYVSLAVVPEVGLSTTHRCPGPAKRILFHGQLESAKQRQSSID